MPSVCGMNYREQLVLPSSTRVEVRAPGHPDLSRVIEVPSAAPQEWLAYAYLLSVGVDADAHDLSELGLRQEWGYERWSGFSDYPDPVNLRGPAEVHWPGLAHELEIDYGERFDPAVGDARVVVRAPGDQHPSPQPDSDWLSSAPQFHADAVNRELVRKFGVVLPYFSSSGLEHSPFSRVPTRTWQSTPLIDELWAGLPPVRRLALHAHLEATGVLDAGRHPDEEVLRAAVEPLLCVLGRIGPDGVEQDPDTGWLPARFLTEAAVDLGWDGELEADPCVVLADLARGGRLIRRLRGRVVLTAAARDLQEDAIRSIALVIDALGPRGRYTSGDSDGRFETAAAVLAIADGSARSLADLTERVQHATSERRRFYDGDDWPYWGDDSDRERVVSRVVAAVVSRFRAISAPGAFGEISESSRAIAAAMLV